MWSWRGRGTSWSIVPERRRRSCLECSPSWAASSRPPRPAPRQPRAGAAGSFAARPSSPPNLHGIIRYGSNVERDLTRSLAPAGGGDGSVAGGGHQPVAALPGAVPPPQGGARAGVARAEATTTHGGGGGAGVVTAEATPATPQAGAGTGEAGG